MIELAPYALVLAVVAVAVVVELHRRHRFVPDEIPTVFVYGFTLALIAFGLAAWSPAISETLPVTAQWIGRATSGMLGLVAVASVASGGWRRTPLFTLGTAMVSVAAAATWLAGDGLPFDSVLPFVVTLVVLTATPFSTAAVAFRVARRAALLVVATSVVAWWVGREWRVATFAYARRGWAPFTTERVAGVLGDPNALAPIAAFAFVTSMVLIPRGWRRNVSAAVSAWVVWATEARVQMLACVAALVVVWLWRERSRQSLRPIALCVAAIVTFTALLPRSSGWSFLPRDQLTSLSGRTDVWQASIDVWREHPMIGAGLRVFDAAFRLESGLGYAGQAHNQLFQHLATTGAVGVVLLALFLISGWRLLRSLDGIARDAALGISVVAGAYLLTAGPLTPSGWSPALLFTTLVLAVVTSGREVGHSLPRTGSAGRGAHPAGRAASRRGRVPHAVADAPRS